MSNLRDQLQGRPDPVRALLIALLLTTLLLIAAGSPALGQSVRGTISGTVADESGGVIPGAEVSLFNVETEREIRTIITNDSGVYRFVEIEPGLYEVFVQMTGFANARSEPLKLEPNRNIRLDITLSIAGQTETVIVTAGVELIDRESATLGTTVEHRRVEGLPLNGRNALNLALLQPGVNDPPASANFGTGLNIAVNGQRGTQNNVTLDGSNNNEVAVGSAAAPLPPPDAIEEFRVLTSNFEAEFGRNTGSIINVVTRAGSRRLHGNVRFFWRPTILSAARFFDKARASAETAEEDLRRTFERKEFGGNIGGPVYIPGLYDGRDRSFFFFDYEGRRQLLGDSQLVTNLPSLAERSGDFSGLGQQIFDPATGEPFPNNQIPQNRMSPIGLFYTSFLPDPDASGEALVAANGITNFDQFVGRFDHALTASQTLTYSLNFYDFAQDDPFAFGGADVPGFGSSNLRTAQVHTVRHTYIVSPSLVNSYQFGYTRNNQPGVAPQNSTSASSIGFDDDSFVANRTFEGPPYINLFDRNIQLGNSIQGPQARVSENFQMQDGVTWIAGNHSFKFGFDGTFYKKDQTFLFVNQGIFTYSGLFGGNTTGNDYADLLIGTSPIAAQFGANGLRDDRQWATAIFAQDSWRFSPQWTFSLGLRWEYNSPITDAFDRVAYYRPGSISERLVNGSLTTLGGQVITVPTGGRAPDGLVYPGDPDNVLGGTVPRGGIRKDWNNFAPRIGVAYSPEVSDGWLRALLGDQQTVIRAGFGVFYGAIIGDGQLQQLSAPGYNGTNSFFFPGSGTLARPFDPDPFPDYNGNQGQLPNPFAADQFFVSAPLSQMSRPIDPNIRTPYTYHYNLTIERGFLNDYVFTASYVGNRSLKMYAIEQVNPSLGTFIPAPEGREIPTPSASNANARRLNADIRLGLGQTVSAGNSWYNALQLQVQKRYSQGLSLQASYTWSKTITDLATFGSGASTVGGNHPRAVLDLVNRDAGRGLALEDVPHRFVGSWIWDLPFFDGMTGPAAYVLDGWSFGGIATFASGRPFQVFNPFDTTGSGGAIVSFADRGASFTQLDPRENDARAFNADAFSIFGDPADGFVLAEDFRRGTLGPTQFRLHNGINNFDLILKKNTPLWAEDVNLELRFELFNAFNHTQFTTADLNLLSPTFGKFNGAAESRVIQLAARISF